MTEAKAFSVTVDDKGIGTLTFDLAGEKVNKFSGAVMAELDQVLDELKTRNDIKLLAIVSAKKNIFIAGADLNELAAIDSHADALSKAKQGQDLFNKLENLPMPTVAVIDGACMGGGTELSLACNYRIATDSIKTSIGLPEVNLGILPGWGGTQRLPRLIGLSAALGIILGGKPVKGDKALRLHLVDAYVAHEFLAEESMKFFTSVLDNGRKIVEKRKPKGVKSAQAWALEGNVAGRQIVFSKARDNVLKATKGKFPAPLTALAVIEKTIGEDLTAGLAAEAAAFADLACTEVSKNLVQLFFTSEALKKEGSKDVGADREIAQAGVLGAGVMGGGIGWLFSYKDIPVRMKDISWDAVSKGYDAAHKIYSQLVKIRKLKPNDVTNKMHKLSGGIDYTGFKKIDVVVEAVVENIDIKKTVLTELEGEVNDQAILCSNTSALSINTMAEPLKRPENFCGMHFFNPVNRMPLVEIIPGEKTSAQTIATVVALTKKIGKTPVVVQDCPGFLVNRILIPYMNESVLMLQEGAGVEKMDRLIADFGMPMGPFVLADEVGIDVGFKVAKILEAGYGDRMAVAGLMGFLYEDKKLLGKKDNLGFYSHGKSGSDRCLNPQLLSHIGEFRSREKIMPVEISDADVVDRAILMMVNEAARCLEEKVIARADFLDMAMIMGTGFPPFRGGLCRYADQRGIKDVVDTLTRLAKAHGERFKPAQLLVDMAADNKTFYGEIN